MSLFLGIEKSIAAVKGTILEFLGAQLQPCTEKQIMRLVRGRKTYKVPALRKLVRDGQVIRSGTGIRGNPYLYSIPTESVGPGEIVVIEEIVI